MKNKALTIILSATLITCIGVSIYQLNTASALKNRLSVLTNTKNELTAEIENKTEELKNITSETEEMSNTISELTVKMDSLNLLAEEMQSEIKSLEEAQSIEVNSAHTDVVLGDDEYKGDSILDNTEAQEELIKVNTLALLTMVLFQNPHSVKQHQMWLRVLYTKQFHD